MLKQKCQDRALTQKVGRFENSKPSKLVGRPPVGVFFCGSTCMTRSSKHFKAMWEPLVCSNSAKLLLEGRTTRNKKKKKTEVYGTFSRHFTKKKNIRLPMLQVPPATRDDKSNTQQTGVNRQDLHAVAPGCRAETLGTGSRKLSDLKWQANGCGLPRAWARTPPSLRP